MHNNELLIRNFYSAFQQRDYRTMGQCYADDAVFSDPVFGLLQGQELRAMWKMLCLRAQSLQLEFDPEPSQDEEYAQCKWTATYRFSSSGRMVRNEVKAYMRIAEGKILEHTDRFDLWKWSRQALGLKGSLLGWSVFFQQKIQQRARRSLAEFIAQGNLD